MKQKLLRNRLMGASAQTHPEAASMAEEEKVRLILGEKLAVSLMIAIMLQFH